MYEFVQRLVAAHDRIDGDELPLIHDFIALMLGVRRPGVTIALHDLENRGVITAGRSSIVVTISVRPRGGIARA